MPGFVRPICWSPSFSGKWQATWWPDRALLYAQYATDWLSAPPGTKYGHFQHYSLKQLGAFG